MIVHSPYNRTLFGEVQVATPYTLGDYQGYHGLDAELYPTATTATGDTVTQNVNLARIDLTVTGSSGSRAYLQTKRQHRYQAGREQRILTTVEHSDAGQANQIRRWGYFDTNDGLFFELNGTTLNVVRRTSTSGSPVDTPVASSSWSTDKFNGSGPSGQTLDLTKGSIYEIRFEYLGVGVIVFLINGWVAHVIEMPNTLANVYMKCAHLPLSWEVVNTGASSAGTMSMNCSNVTSMGGEAVPSYSYGFPQARAAAAANTEVYGFSIRVAPTFASQQNRSEIQPIFASLQSETNRASLRLLLNATLTGTTFAATVPTGSACQIDTAGSLSSGGIELFRGFAPSSSSGAALTIALQETFPKLGRSLKRWTSTAADCDVLTLMMTNETTGTSDLTGHLGWKEIR